MLGTNASDPARKPQDRRKRVAIAYADMAGYSRLICPDDSGTRERLRALRRNLIDPANRATWRLDCTCGSRITSILSNVRAGGINPVFNLERRQARRGTSWRVVRS